MSTPLLATKLYIPAVRPNLVNRERLMAQLRPSLHGKLTLVSAPAGFGKSTLVSTWVQRAGCPVAWLALDETDHDLNRFLSYLIAALQTIAPALGQGVLRLLQSPHSPAVDLLLTTLVNELATLSDQQILVLDDYHLLDARPIDEAMAFLLDHLPPQLHIVITTREDPNLPLARLRARGQLTEIRAHDLRFTAEEATTFLNQMMRLNLTTEEVAALDARTEGWIAGLQLAALSLRSHHATGEQSLVAAINSFTGSHRFVMDYLVEEVLQQQPAAVQHFLLHTSILERLCGPLCDALLQSAPGSGQAMLDRLEEANMFLIALDNERCWYRYHHLFAELLQQRLTQQKDEANIATYHSRAAHWYEKRGMDLTAFHHAVAADDVAHAKALAEGKEVPLYHRDGLPQVKEWLSTLPTTTLDANPTLWVIYASVLTMSGQLMAEIEEKLVAAERVLVQPNPDLPPNKVDDLHGQIASIRAMLAIPLNDAQEIQVQSQRALEFLDPGNLPIRTSAAWTLGFAYQLKGERAAAMRAHQQAIAVSEQSGNTMMTMAAATCLAQVQESETQLRKAAATFQQVVAVAGEPPWPAACEAHHGLARIHYQWNQLAAAQEHGELGLALAHQLPNVDTPATCLAVLALIKLAQDDVDGAVEHLRAADEFLADRHVHHQIDEIATVRNLLLLRQGAFGAAQTFVDQAQLPALQARVLLAQQDTDGALALLESHYQTVVAKGWRGEALTLLVLQALAHQQAGDLDQALHFLTEALTLAEPEGYVRIFIDEGPSMAQLLQHAAARHIRPSYTTTLLATFAGSTAESAPAPQVTLSSTFVSTHAKPQPLIEPLSERELEVLQLIAQGLSNRAIGERLFIALDTVKGHNRKIFGKLQVQRRTEAVARARELGLVP